MIISIDREDGLFTAEMSDRINTKSTQLFENIQSLDVPVKQFKEKVSLFQISTSNDIEQHCYSIGRTHIINFKLRSNISSSENFQLFGEIPFTPVTDLIWMSNKAIYKIPANQTKMYIYPFSNGTKDDNVYSYFIS